MFNLDVTHKCLIAECWCPVSDLDQIQDALRRGTVCIANAFISVPCCFYNTKWYVCNCD